MAFKCNNCGEELTLEQMDTRDDGLRICPDCSYGGFSVINAGSGTDTGLDI